MSELWPGFTIGPATAALRIEGVGPAAGGSGARVVAGVGARPRAGIGDIRLALGEALVAAGVRARDVVEIVTVDVRAGEPALAELAEMMGVPVRGFAAAQLAGIEVPNPSAGTQRALGTPSVAEAAVLATGAELILPKRVSHGVTVALGRLTRLIVELDRDHEPDRKIDLDLDLDLDRDRADRPSGAVVDLSHHGDAEAGPGLIDLAVNVRGPAPAWLQARLRDAVAGLAAYPNPVEATAAVAARHARPAAEVLLTAGAAEAFVLLARVLAPRRAVVVHPQFTEPEAALNAAGHSVHRVVLPPPFALDPALVPDEADLVMMGNPTNPTSVLHPVADLLALARPGRILVVDEAFMDAVPGEPQSLAGSPQRLAPDLPGLVVVRSLTKTWGLAGLRIGYLLGPPELLAACAGAQPLWPVGSLGLAAAIACSSPRALAAAHDLAERGGAERDHLLAALDDLPEVEVAALPRAPFVLLRTYGPDPAGVHGRLRAAGWAVRRADTFPGLGPGWLRAAIRDRATSEAFVAALAAAVRAGRPR